MSLDLFDHLPIPSFTSDLDGIVLQVNAAMLELLGRTREQLIGAAFPMFLRPEDRASDREARHQLVRGVQKRVHFEVRLNMADGSRQPVLVLLSLEHHMGREVFLGSMQIASLCAVRQEDPTSSVEQVLREASPLEVSRDPQKLQFLVDFARLADDSEQAFMDFALEQAIFLTASKLGFLYLYQEKTRTFTLLSWSRDVAEACSIREPRTTYHLEKTGLWGEVVRQRAPVVWNDFQSPHPLQKGYPTGHAHLERFLSIPVVREGQGIVAVAGVANKETDYDTRDQENLEVFCSKVWDVLDRRKLQEQQNEEERRFRRVFDLTTFPTVILDLHDFRVKAVHFSLLEMLGWSRSQVRGRTLSEIGIWADPSEGLSLLMECCEKSMVWERKVKLRCADGHLLSTAVSLRVFDLDSRWFIAFVVQDLSDHAWILQQAQMQGSSFPVP